jgi:hypothetical protein
VKAKDFKFDDIDTAIKELLRGFPKYLDVCHKIEDLCSDLNYTSFVPMICSVISKYAADHDQDNLEILADITINMLKGEAYDRKPEKDEKDEDA